MRAYWRLIWIDGVAAGLLGYAALAIFFAVSNALLGRSPFFTPALLGGILFYGLRDPAAVEVWAGPVLAFNGLHLLVFLVIGVLAAWLTAASERRPQLWFAGIVVFLFGWIHLYLLVLWVAEPVAALLPVWMITGASLVAAAVMVLYLWERHPVLRREVLAEQGAPGERQQ